MYVCTYVNEYLFMDMHHQGVTTPAIRYSLISLANCLSNVDVGASPASTCSHISLKSEE